MPAIRKPTSRPPGPSRVKIWLDAHLAPAIAAWLKAKFDLEAVAVRDVGLLEAEDQEIFDAARNAGACVMTKDRDFVELVHRMGSPPHVLWLTCGNTSSARLREILAVALPGALQLLEHGEPLVEVTDHRER